MTTNKDRKALVRTRMAKTGESYMAARRHIVDDLRPSEPNAGSFDLNGLKGLLRRMNELLAELENRACFTLAPEPADTFDPPKGSIRLNEEWRMGLVSTVALLAEHLHLGFEVRDIADSWAAFGWVTPETIEENPYVVKARRLSAVARRLLLTLDPG